MGSGGGMFGSSTSRGSMYSGCCLVSLLNGVLALIAVAAVITGIVLLIV